MGCFRKLAALALLAIPSAAQAWENHALLTDTLTSAQAQLHPDDRPKWADAKRTVSIPCPTDEKKQFADWARKYELNSERMPPLTTSGCGELRQVSVAKLMSQFVDEPDTGMDQDLPDAFDPKNERAWMGGKKGTSSQGFRHMLFAGWDWKNPFASFQTPLHRVGQAHERFGMWIRLALSPASSGQPGLSTFWRLRALSWSLHFLQDLSQPWHSTQIPSLRLVPWYHLAHWPITDQIKTFVPETTRIFSNYHLGYENWVLRLMQAKHPDLFGFDQKGKCFSDGDLRAELAAKLKESPERLALEVAARSHRLAHDLSIELAELFGPEIRREGVKLTESPNDWDYDSLTHDPAKTAARSETLRITCQALQLASEATRVAIDLGTSIAQ